MTLNKKFLYSSGSQESFGFLFFKGELLSSLDVQGAYEWEVEGVIYRHLETFERGELRALEYETFKGLDSCFDLYITQALACHSDLFHEGTKLLPRPFHNQKNEVLFPGSFNPWHDGHQACVDLLKDKVCVLPDENPWKDQEKQRVLKRVFDLAKAVQGAALYTGFIGKEKNPTVRWLGRLRERRALLMGADSFLSLHKWIEASRLLGDLEALYIASRQESEKDFQDQKKRLQQINPELKINFLGHHDFEKLSSTSIRNKLDEAHQK